MVRAEVYKRAHLSESYWPADSSKDFLNASIVDELRKAAAEVPDRFALVEGIEDSNKRRRWTYAQLLADAEQVARALLARYKVCDRVAVWADNIPEWVLLEYGCAIAGITLVTINPANRVREIVHILNQSGAVALFTIDLYRGNRMLEVVRETKKDLPALRDIYRFAEFTDFMNSGTKLVDFPHIKPEDPFMIIYTSGTTGVQKGCLMNHVGHLNADYFVAERAGLKKGGVWINPMPMFHNAGCCLATLGSLRVRGTHVIVNGFDPAQILNLFETEKGSFALLVPTMLEMILAFSERKKYDLSAWTNIMTGAAFVEKQLVERLRKDMGCSISIVFGQTESQGCVTGTHEDDSLADQTETIGQPLPWCEIKIGHVKTCETLPLNTDGEICIRGYQVMMGYYNMPEATANAITPDGWLRTGDIGAMDERGFLKITGRLKEMIIRGGENIYPREIESLLEEHPKVGKAVVVGIPHQKWGEEVAAVITSKSVDDMPTPQELHDYCRANLTYFKTPRLWSFTDTYDYTTTGKLQKFKLRDKIVSGELRHVRT